MKTIEQIAAELQAYDPQALSASTALLFLEQMVEPVTQVENVPLIQVLGRVVAQDVIAPVDVPAHDNSAMDGFAFAGEQISDDHDLELEVIGTALAGANWSGSVSPGQCLKIMTGAVMPTGLDTVVPLELAELRGDRVVIAAGAVKPGENRRLRGEDLKKGQTALAAGTRIGPAALGLLASLGLPAVAVLRRLRVAFFSTGDEILALGDAPREGAVYDSNRYCLFGLLSKLGVEVLDLGIVRDNPPALEAAFAQACAWADAVITSGGVSVGEADHTKAIMQKLAGGQGGVAFWKIAMRPGRPMAVGRVGNAVLFGLPGNPVAVMVTFLAFVRPAVLRMMGCRPDNLPMLQARATEAIRKKPGRTEYQRGIVTAASDGALWVSITGQQGSGVLSSMVQANGLMVLPHAQGNVAVGDPVSVMMFDGVL
jgi:molybdopterin molybdotransferase